MDISTTGGKVRGTSENGYHLFKGIPYAVAQRFQPPQPVHWDDVFIADRYGEKAMQDGCPPGGKPFRDDGIPYGEACHNMNIYTPSIDGALPVLVDIHGGAFQRRFSYLGKPFGRGLLQGQPFVYISFNYRLGAWGYLELSEQLGNAYAGSGNCGLLDQIAALEWIRDNVKAFGGDPNRVTVLGCSAGAHSIAGLMMALAARTLFHQAILSSGGIQTMRDVASAATVTKQLMTELNITDARELLTVPTERLMAAQSAVCDIRGGGSGRIFGVVADGVTIPLDWAKRLADGLCWKGHVITGTGRREYAELSDITDSVERGERIEEVLKGLLWRDMSYAKTAYEQAGEQGVEAWCRVISDIMFRIPSLRFARALAKAGSRVWQYSLELMPATHGMDENTIWGDPEKQTPDQRKLSDILCAQYTAFVTTGTPDLPNLAWPESYRDGEKGVIMRLNIPCVAEEQPEDEASTVFPEWLFGL